MKKSLGIAICLAVIFVFASFAQAQALKRAKGNFCGYTVGDLIYISMRVGGAEKFYIFDGYEPAVKYAGFKNERQKDLSKLPVGTEMIIDYVFKRPTWGGSRSNIFRKITLTGNVNKKTKPCVDE